MSEADGRAHVPLSAIEGYVHKRVRGAFTVHGSPPAAITVDPASKILALRVVAAGRAADVSPLRRVVFESLLDGDTIWHQLAVEFDQDLDEVYALLCSIVDRVQLSGEGFAEATEAAVDSLAGILERRSVLSLEQQIGLAGELLVLLAIAETDGVAAAAAAWRGPRGEEHDFGTADWDLEVKTTLSERREHWISSATQLTPTVGRALYLASIQLTRAGGSTSGWSLPELVDVARSKEPRTQEIENLLRGVAYRDAMKDLLSERWTLRTAPAFYAVENDFPTITLQQLAEVVPRYEHITDVRYRLDLTGLAPTEPLVPFSEITIDRE